MGFNQNDKTWKETETCNWKKKKKVRWSTDPEWVQRADEDFKAAITNMYVGLKKMS